MSARLWLQSKNMFLFKGKLCCQKGESVVSYLRYWVLFLVTEFIWFAKRLFPKTIDCFVVAKSNGVNG